MKWHITGREGKGKEKEKDMKGVGGVKMTEVEEERLLRRGGSYEKMSQGWKIIREKWGMARGKEEKKRN